MVITVNQKRETFFTSAKTFMQCGQQEKCQENISGSLLSIFQPGVESDNTSEMFKFKYNKRHQLRSNNCKLYLQKPKTNFMKNRFYTEVPQHGTLCPMRLLIILIIVFPIQFKFSGFCTIPKKTYRASGPDLAHGFYPTQDQIVPDLVREGRWKNQ